MPSYKRHHYVPQWYQYRFLDGCSGENKFHYLDMNPETCTAPNGKKYQRKALLRWGPPRCFYKENLYTTKFPGWESTEIEERFFGEIDAKGKDAVEYFSDFAHPSVNPDAFNAFLPYISSQKLRTPRGLGYLKKITKSKGKNALLFELQKLHRMHCALWTESVWSIVHASESNTKFIISDNPVTAYNQNCFPESHWCRGFNEPGIWLDGTHSIFPLSSTKCLILTNLSWARNPYGNPLRGRPNPELFRSAMFNFTTIQTNRMLSEEEVISINYVIKKRADRYIAAAKEDWLYPEKHIDIKRWDDIGKSYLLMPDPRSMTFSSEMFIGYKGGRTDSFDEYGRKVWHSDYNDEKRRSEEWNAFQAFQGEYARLFGPKRRGVSFEFGRIGEEEDSEDFHNYHLSLEQEYKPLLRRRRRKRR